MSASYDSIIVSSWTLPHYFHLYPPRQQNSSRADNRHRRPAQLHITVIMDDIWFSMVINKYFNIYVYIFYNERIQLIYCQPMEFNLAFHIYMGEKVVCITEYRCFFNSQRVCMHIRFKLLFSCLTVIGLNVLYHISY